MKKVFFYETDIGEIGIAEDENKITNVFLSKEENEEECILEETEVIKNAGKQLLEYISGRRKYFDLPLYLEGSEFRVSVWNELSKIPYGSTSTYGEIAKSIGNHKASRAVGLANNKNAIPIFIPCHRVIGASGKLVGYRGGIEMKEKLLHIENINR